MTRIPVRRAHRPSWVGGLLLLLLPGILALPVAAEERHDPSRIGVLGVDEFQNPKHREGLTLIQYTPDPIEGFNRVSLGLTRPMLHWFFRPIAKGFRFVAPTGVRKSFDRFGYNLAFPARWFALLLQGRPVDSSVELGRFVVNTTAGLGGFFDPAGRLGIPTYREDVGQAFATWGAGPGFYFFIPLLGPSSGRDAAGRLFDTALNPATYVPGLGLLLNVNAFSFRIDTWETLNAMKADLYYPVRALWATRRQIEVENYEIPESDWATSDPEPSLGSLRFRVQNPRFVGYAREGRVHMPNTGRDLPYSLWMQKAPTPIVYIVPGIGAHRTSSTPLALAELAWNAGYSVVTVSNPFNWEFILNGLSTDYPGYTPSDADDLITALTLIDADIQRRHQGAVTSRRLLGYSLGGIETLFVAAHEKARGEDSLRFDRFVALNPPVHLRHAGDAFDAYFDAPLRWPAEERDRKIIETVMKAFLMTQRGMQDERGLPFDRTESEFLIGLAGRAGLINAIAAMEQRGARGLEVQLQEGDDPGMGHPLNQTSLRRYGDELIIPYYIDRFDGKVDRETLAARASLPTQADRLRTHDRVRVLTNADDFILGDEGVAFLRENFGERLTLFPGGGHMGNLHLPEVQAKVLEALATGDETATKRPVLRAEHEGHGVRIERAIISRKGRP